MPTATRTRTRTGTARARARLSTMTNGEPAKDTTKTKVVIPEGTKAEIIEQLGGKTIQYEAEVTEDTADDQTELFGDEETNTFIEADSEGFLPPDYQENPKSGLDKAFDDIAALVTAENMTDHFFAKIARLPDGIGENWNIPARDRFELGVVSFTSRDRFAFITELQKINNNSGGKLAIDVYDSEHRPLLIQRQRHHIPSQIAFQVVVQNPPPKPIEDTANGQQSGIGQILQAIQQQNREMLEFLKQTINRPREKSALENAIEQKVLNDILNPPQQGTNSFEQAFTNMMMLPVFAQKMSEKMFPETPAPAEPTTFDRIMQLLDKPAIQNAANNVMDVINQAAQTKMLISQRNAGIPIETIDDTTDNDSYDEPMPEQQQYQQANPQAVLITTILSELESDRELNASNTTMQHLQAEYPTQVNLLKMTCKGGSFDDVFNMLIDQTASIQPYPFAQYIDVERSQAENKVVLNIAGERIKGRLLEFYNYVRTT